MRFRAVLFVALSLFPVASFCQRTNNANWLLANRFSNENVQLFVGTSTVNPNFIQGTDRFWYVWRSAAGTQYKVVDPEKKAKGPLFDHVKLAAQLSELSRKPFDAINLSLGNLRFAEKGNILLFQVEENNYEYDLDKETLRKLPRPTPPAGQARPQGASTGRQGGQGGPTQQGAAEYRNWSPDRKSFVYAQNHNLFFVTIGEDKKESDPIQLTTDGAEFYSFGNTRSSLGGDTSETTESNRRVRPAAVWSDDSKRFYIVRADSRKVKDLWLVNVLAEPRPTLMTYKYAMPGEEFVSLSELWLFDRDAKKLSRAPVEKYKDQRLFNIHWPNTSDRLRLVRRDRLQRNLELIDLDTRSNDMKVLLTESVENAFLETQPLRYLREGGDFIWWSERTGWGHYYLYSYDGKLKFPITSGAWRAESIVAVDADKGLMYFTAVGKEIGENPYYSHLYRTNLSNGDITLLDPGNADHNSRLSPSRRWVVDVSSRVDMAPVSVLRNSRGDEVMQLETMDLSRLKETGWQMPETFVLKSADGINDIFGNLWKPFDFNPNKSYPIILHVYPGPQTEGVSSTFSAYSSNQQLAQLGFIVIQVGNRGGNPQRSNAYHSYGYYNLRDYGLADKRAAVQQLAAKYPWIDIERVGIYGHSGGGFMTAAAMMLPPYNDFFKVGVSSAGNHDNNIYNQNWSEQHHGLREVKVQTGSTRTPEEELPEFADAPDEQTKFEIKVPTTVELAANLKGKLLLVHGDMDNNVHPGNTIRLVNALIKANKRFDFMLMPGQAHGFGPMSGYFQQMSWEYFCEHLLGDRYNRTAEMSDKSGGKP